MAQHDFFNNNNKLYTMSKILIAFIAGLGLGLLLAPKTGADPREKLADWLGEAADNARDTVKRGIHRGESAAEDLESRVRNAVKE